MTDNSRIGKAQKRAIAELMVDSMVSALSCLEVCSKVLHSSWGSTKLDRANRDRIEALLAEAAKTITDAVDLGQVEYLSVERKRGPVNGRPPKNFLRQRAAAGELNPDRDYVSLDIEGEAGESESS